MTHLHQLGGVGLGAYISIALDAQDNPHICYYHLEDDNLEYAVKTDGSWTIQTVDATPGAGKHASLAVNVS